MRIRVTRQTMGAGEMSIPYSFKKFTYSSKDGNTTYQIYHPAIRFENNEPYCCLLDPNSKTGLIEHFSEDEAIAHAKNLYYKLKEGHYE